MRVTVFARTINDYCGNDAEYVINEIDKYMSNFSEEDIQESEEMSWQDYYDELVDGLPVITSLTQVAFKEKVEEWATLNGTVINDIVRGYVDGGHDRFMVAHGIGYDWIDADVLGGNGSGKMRRKFVEWLGDNSFEFLDV